MILAVKCDRPSFREVHFLRGLNVVLADRTKQATRKDTRNGLGKSTLIEIIHFCLGGALSGTLKDEHLADWTFTLDLELAGKPVSVSRNTTSQSRVRIEADSAGWPISPKLNRESGHEELSIQQWNSLLGTLMFGIPIAQETGSFQPGFRGLIAYFIRRGPDAYSIPFEQHRKQREVDVQVLNAFLLQLDWSYAIDWHKLKDKERLINELKKSAQTGPMKDFLGGTLGDLEARKVRLELELQKGSDQLSSFRVHPQYEDIERRASELTREIHELENKNFVDLQRLAMYQKSVAEEAAPSSDDLLRVYEEASVVLPDSVKKKFEQVKEFHHTLVDNRREFLESEIDLLTRRIDSRRVVVTSKGEERSSLMAVLQTHGALEEYTILQQLHMMTMAQLNDVERRIQNLKAFEQGKSEVAIEKQLLLRRARADLEQRHSKIRRAIALFNENSQALYQSPGTLAIDVAETGYKFHIEIERSKSEGIGNMKVFCYDLMLSQLWAERADRPSFLVHDSTIFDGVDERQRALALELANNETKQRGFQYICMLNSDLIPIKDFSKGFNFTGFVRLRLTDATEDGGLLGIRF